MAIELDVADSMKVKIMPKCFAYAWVTSEI